MNSCVLRPPNSQQLSDDVIGDVMPRAPQAERCFVQGYGRSSRSSQVGPPTASVEQLAAPEISSAARTQKCKRRRFTSSNAPTEQQRLRELRRVRQIRYRKKKDEYANDLEAETQQLRGEVDKLEQRLRSVSSATPAKESVWGVATEYFRLFRFGLPASSGTAQLSFVRNTMSSELVFNAGRGPEAMTRNWRWLSLWFQDVELGLEGLDKRAAGSLIAGTTTSVTITERTLRNVFPHLSNDEFGDTAFAKKLLNQRIVMCGSTCFEWDAALGRVTSVSSQSDMLTPMLRLLGSLEGVARVFEKALISPTFQWRLRA
jgi:hypothetical protein